MDWTEFQQGLSSTLGTMSNGNVLIVVARADEKVRVQFEVDEDAQLKARTSSDQYLPTQLRLNAAEAGALAAAGWQQAEGDETGLWSRQVEFPASTADLHDLAAASVRALRDLRGVPSPDELWYRAWRNPEPEPSHVDPEIADDLDWGEIPVEWPSLGIAIDEPTVTQWRTEYPLGHFDPYPDYELTEHVNAPR